MIIVIRGTNGCGKSHTVREILKQGRRIKAELIEGSSLIRLPRVTRPVLIVGPYIPGRSMGGCDCIRRPSHIYALIDAALLKEWHVLLEGVVLATTPFLKYHATGIDVRMMLLDPPIAACREQIDRRQKLKGHVSKLSERAMLAKQAKARDMYAQVRAAGMTAVRFDEAGSPVPARWVAYQLRRA